MSRPCSRSARCYAPCALRAAWLRHAIGLREAKTKGAFKDKLTRSDNRGLKVYERVYRRRGEGFGFGF